MTGSETESSIGRRLYGAATLWQDWDQEATAVSPAYWELFVSSLIHHDCSCSWCFAHSRCRTDVWCSDCAVSITIRSIFCSSRRPRQYPKPLKKINHSTAFTNSYCYTWQLSMVGSYMCITTRADSTSRPWGTRVSCSFSSWEWL